MQEIANEARTVLTHSYTSDKKLQASNQGEIPLIQTHL
jgi:hypothetical protein